ncbi:hypothetical protein S245_039937, partial [Arachis hypogaea]
TNYNTEKLTGTVDVMSSISSLGDTFAMLNDVDVYLNRPSMAGGPEENEFQTCLNAYFGPISEQEKGWEDTIVKQDQSDENQSDMRRRRRRRLLLFFKAFRHIYLAWKHFKGQNILTEIQWHPRKCLTHKILKKKPQKGSKNAKPITRPKTVRVSSIHHKFLKMAEELQNQMEQDYDIGLTIRDKIIPHAVSWFIDEAIQGEEFGDLEDDDEDDIEEDDDDEEDEDEDEETKTKKKYFISCHHLRCGDDFVWNVISAITQGLDAEAHKRVEEHRLVKVNRVSDLQSASSSRSLGSLNCWSPFSYFLYMFWRECCYIVLGSRILQIYSGSGVCGLLALSHRTLLIGV